MAHNIAASTSVLPVIITMLARTVLQSDATVTANSPTNESMNILIKDDQTGGILYGYCTLDQIRRTGKSQRLKVYKIPAEAFIAFLGIRYPKEPTVQTYLAAVEQGEGINPREGALLQAVDDIIDIDPEEWEAALRSGGIDPDDDESSDGWKQK